MIVAQLSDLHFVRPGQLHFGVDTAATTRAAVEHLNAMDPRPDAVVVTGDIADGGTLEQYEAARDVLDLLQSPYYVIPGNHDRRTALKTAFGDHLSEDSNGFVQYAVADHPLQLERIGRRPRAGIVRLRRNKPPCLIGDLACRLGLLRLVALDTLSEGEECGRLDASRLEWLDDTLAAQPDRLTLVFMHHPPFATGIKWMDEMGLQDRAGLDAVLRRHPQVRLVVCGHVHRSISGTIGHARVALAPSTTVVVGLSLGDREPIFGLGSEPLACLLHVLLDDQIVTHTTYVGGATT
jgi:3',5'-cyclic AMP phosphodiesterase CpdA